MQFLFDFFFSSSFFGEHVGASRQPQLGPSGHFRRGRRSRVAVVIADPVRM